MNHSIETIVFATNNAHKLSEIRSIVGDKCRVLSLSDIGCFDDIPETAATLAGNAELKARYVKEKYGYDCFADDTGLMVDALEGAPGVYSARYAGEGHDSQANMKLLLRNLEGITDRTAHFSTVIAFIKGDELKMFEGVCPGKISTVPVGNNGFGYDPIFVPDEADGRTFAQMTDDEKNAVSHRGKATEKFIKHIIETISKKRQ